MKRVISYFLAVMLALMCVAFASGDALGQASARSEPDHFVFWQIMNALREKSK